MYWQNEVEQAALRAYHDDPVTDSDDDSFEQQATELLKNGGKVQKVNRKKRVDDDNDDCEYEGGKKTANARKPEASGGFLSFFGFGKNNGAEQGNDIENSDYSKLNDAQKKKRIEVLWQRARRYNNKLRFQARLQKMAESNLKEMMIDDINEDAEEENQIIDNMPKLQWYLIDTERTFCKVWKFLITWLTIYSLFLSPFIIVFQHVFSCYLGSEYEELKDKDSTRGDLQCIDTKNQKTMQRIELAIDIIYMVEIILNFVKKTRALKDLKTIASNYVTGYFMFDIVATVPGLFYQYRQTLDYYPLKILRIVHVQRLTEPLQLLLHCALQKYSKKRQNDLTSFASLIFYVIYTSHIMACCWLKIGNLQPCKEDNDEPCTASWVYANNFEDKPVYTQYIFAFYWIFEVITTVGYGDYSGKTSYEYIFSIALEFLGLTFFSFLMGSINGIFNTSDNFDDLIEEKLDSLDMWIKKIEKSNKPFHIQPTLYNDIRKYVEQAFLYDFNLVIEEFQFYQQITPKMQTDLIQNTRVFKEFERSFNHFFEECERGFTNELIISMYCRIYTPGKTVISFKSNVKEMYFIRQGLVEVFNNENDEVLKEKPILYLPKYSYFGDYQILYNLKSNIVFKTLAHTPDDKKVGISEPMPDIIFMCIGKDVLNDLCDLFPQTAENIKRRSLERRHRFMQQKNTNSRRYDIRQKAKNNNVISESEHSHQHHKTDGNGSEDQLEDFHTDEEPENFESQKEDMKMYLNKLNKRIDGLVEALKKADEMMAKMGDQKAIIEQINNKKNSKGGKSLSSIGDKKDNRSIAEIFKETVAANKAKN